jgi:hypothetical protein
MKKVHRATQSLPGQTDDGVGFAPTGKLKLRNVIPCGPERNMLIAVKSRRRCLLRKDFVKVAQP